MTILRPFLAVYGTGIVATFAWLFFALSGASACNAGAAPCRAIVGLSGQFALTWPAYWGSRLTGEPIAPPVVPVNAVFISIVVFVAIMLLAKVCGRFGSADSPEDEEARPEPFKPFKPFEPLEASRRNQSAVPPLV